jgi:hypothetical protein
VLKSRRAEIGRVQGPGTKKSGKRREPEKAITQAKMQVRVVGLALLVAVFFVILGFRLWYLQVLSGNEYENSAQATQTRSVKMPAQRGVIYDRNGTVLANNQPGLNVTIIPNAIPREKVEKLADVLDTDKKAVLQNYDAAIASGNQYSPMLIKENASREDVMYVSERTEEFEGLVVNDDYIRNYPKGEVASHVLGYGQLGDGRGGGCHGPARRPDRRDGKPPDVRPADVRRRYHRVRGASTLRVPQLRRGARPVYQPGDSGCLSRRLDVQALYRDGGHGAGHYRPRHDCDGQWRVLAPNQLWVGLLAELAREQP